MSNGPSNETLKQRLYRIIFASDTPAGRRFDVVLLYLILISMALVFLESVQEVDQEYGISLRAAEWTITILFTVEHIVRLWVSPKPWHYACSFFGIVDLLAGAFTAANTCLPYPQPVGVRP